MREQAHDAELSTIQAEGMARCQELFRFVREQAGDLEAAEVERGVLARVREIGRLGLEAFFEGRGTGDVGPWLEDDDGAIYVREGRVHTRVYLSLFGKVEVPRTGYRDRGRPAIFPLDAEVNLPKRRYSYPLQEFVNDTTMNQPFRQGVRHLQKWLDQPVWDGSAEAISRESSEDYDAFYEDKPAPTAVSEGDILVGSFDGKGVPMIKKEAAKIQGKLNKGEKRQKKKEAIVGVSYTVEPKVREAEEIARGLVYGREAKSGAEQAENGGEKPRAREIRRIASLEKPKEEIFRTVRADLDARDPEGDHLLAVLVDGDRGLEILAKQTFGDREGVFFVLDVVHAVSYLWEATHALHPEGSDEAKAFAYERLVQILKGRVGYVIGGLKSAKTKRGLRGARANAIDRCVRYFENHKHMMAYDEYLAWGLPIATGVVESACNALVKNRMEGCGMRWSLRGAEAMLRLRSVSLSNDWPAYWKYHIAAEQRRLYGGVLQMVHRAKEAA
jgi:hypothetical protein